MSTPVKVLTLPVLPPTDRLGDVRWLLSTGDGGGGSQFWILQGCSVEIQSEIRDGVFVADGTFVPVVWDAFVAWGPGETSAVAGDGEEGFEDVLVEDAFGVFGGFVGHEAVDECVCGWLDCDAGKGSVEEVWVVGNGLVEPA